MDNIRISLLATLLLFGNATVAMEGQSDASETPASQDTPPQQALRSVRDLLGIACEQTDPLNKDQLLKFAGAIDQTREFTLLTSEQRPAQLKMLVESITQDTNDARNIFSEQYKETWAPRTGIAAGACCLLTVLKPYACGLLDAIPTHEATILLSGFWAAEVKERTSQRTCVNNGSTVLKLIEAKAVTLTQSRIQELYELQKKQKKETAKQRLVQAGSKSGEAEEVLKTLRARSTSQDADQQTAQEGPKDEMVVEETKKDK